MQPVIKSEFNFYFKRNPPFALGKMEKIAVMHKPEARFKDDLGS